jgi:hypothetical protein
LPILLTATGGMELIEGVNYVFDTLLFAGTILLLTSALPQNPALHLRLEKRAERHVTT